MNISSVFELYQRPRGALNVRCHVLSKEQAKALEEYVSSELPECYVAKAHFASRVVATGLPPNEVMAQFLPDPGSTMSGDFGEILSMFFFSSEHAAATTLVKKWCYKQDRRKPTPHSDVVILHRSGPGAQDTDFVICAEAKQKATNGTFDPISDSVASLSDDRIGRLARSLAWMRERAITLGPASDIHLLERFIKISEVSYKKLFKAVAIIDRKLLDSELLRQLQLPEQDDEFEVVVLGIPDLKNMYQNVFARAIAEAKV